MLTLTLAGKTGTGEVRTGLILNYTGKLYAQPKKGFIGLKKTVTDNKALFKKSLWSVTKDQLYFATKDLVWSYKKGGKTEGIAREKVILNADGEYENSLIEKIYVGTHS